MTVDNTLGSDIMPEGQVMVMRHLRIRGGDLIQYNDQTQKNEVVNTGKRFLETRLYRTDSLLSSNTGVGYMGVRRSDTLGVRTAGFASTLLYMNDLDKETGFGYMPIFDTMKLVLSIKDYGGDTLAPIRYKVYELKKSLAENVLKYDEQRDLDSIAYINCDLSGVYDESKPTFEFTFPNSELKEGPSTLMIPMESTEHSWDFARRLMLIPDNYADSDSDWDGYGRSGIEIYSDDKKWVETFYGIYIKPDLDNTTSNRRGAMYALDLSESGIMLQGRSRNPKDPTMIKDTVGMYYYFNDDSSKFNGSVNKVDHDYTKSLTGGVSLLNGVVMDGAKSREERTEVATCYVEGMGGPATEVYITDALFDEMIALETTATDSYTKMGINQCTFTIYVDNADYDWNVTQSNAVLLTPLLDKSFTRLGAYLNYNRLNHVFDYNYLYEKEYGTETTYGGYLDRSRGCYVMNITAYIQHLYNYAKRVRQEDGSYAFNESDVDYVGRTFYIGTEATAPYLFTESVLQVTGVGLAAPIQIDLTYTLVK
jgi:hypothetical protein